METDIYHGLEPTELWHHFAQLSEIPRSSGCERAAREYVRAVAQRAGASFAVDHQGNAVVGLGATDSVIGAPLVVIQAHLDMVSEKWEGVTHNFQTDAITVLRDGDVLSAAGTTLGADNGIGVAACLALITQPGLHHGPLELLFTVEEETGLQGAMALDPSLVKSRLLINLDSEDSDEITIGSAGGLDLEVTLGCELEVVTPGSRFGKITISGLKGGHSGLRIGEPHANAIKLLTSVLQRLARNGYEYDLCSIRGGTARNAIPRSAEAVVSVSEPIFESGRPLIDKVFAALQSEWCTSEPALEVDLRRLDNGSLSRLLPTDRDALLSLLDQLPHGAATMSEPYPSKVETSSNVALVQVQEDKTTIVLTARSLKSEALQRIGDDIVAIGERLGGTVQIRSGYPCWTPQHPSRLLGTAMAVFERVYGVPPAIEVVHAGLECGVIVAKAPGMHAVSFGPRIIGAHTPTEHVYSSTVSTTWSLLLGMLDTIASDYGEPESHH